MSHTAFPRAADLSDLVEPAIALADRWLSSTTAATTRTERKSAERIADMVGDVSGLDLAVHFIDRVVRPESNEAAAKALTRLPSSAGGFLGPVDRAMLWLGSVTARIAPNMVVPMARARLRHLVGHMVSNADGASLARQLREAADERFQVNLNLLGEAVLGEAEAVARTRRTHALLERSDVDYVSIKVSSMVPQISTWDTAGTVRRAAERMRPLLRTAMAKKAFVNLDMEEYRDLDLTVALFTALLGEPEFLRATAGLALQAYLPDSRAALEEILAFARHRGLAGGASIKVRLVKGANLSMERVEAELHGWEQAPYPTKTDVDANYLALIDRALSTEHGTAFRVGVASHNLYSVALAYLIAQGRGVTDRLDVEMLRGMAPAQARAIRETVGSVVLYTPVVERVDFDVAVAYLVRRLEENAAPENFLHSLFGGDITPQAHRFRDAVVHMRDVPPERRRSAGRPPAPPGFANTTDSDPALAEVRAWAAGVVTARPAPLGSTVIEDRAALNQIVTQTRAAHARWAAYTGAERATVLRRAADRLEEHRADLVATMASEGGKTIGEADPEVSEAVDFARWYADRAAELDPDARSPQTDGTRFTPHRLTLVTPPWNFPVAIPAGGMLAALAAGSAVLVKPAKPVPRCTEVIVQALHEAGVPRAALRVVRLSDRTLGRNLVAHPAVDGVVLTGSSDTAELFIDWRSHRPGGHGVVAETSGKNAMIITPAADYDLAVADLVRSAFGHAGQKCSAASLAILVGQVAFSARFQRQLVDAVRSLRMGWPSDLGTTMGPLIEPPEGKLLRGLTRLDDHETWLVEPRRLDDTGRLWSPGLRANIRSGAWFHRTECFGPVLGLMVAKDLKQAIEMQDDVAYGLTGGLHSLDPEEIDYWLDRVEVGNAYVNRHTTGAIVRRQPFGGWKASVVGAGLKAGGPDYVTQLGSWIEVAEPTRGADPSPPVLAALHEFLMLLPDPAERDWLTAAVRSDARVWHSDLGIPRDDSGLAAEENLLRYRPAPLVVRALAGARLVEVLRVVLAAHATGTPIRVSVPPELLAGAPPDSPGRRRLAPLQDAPSSDADFIVGFAGERVRLVGPGAAGFADRMSRPGVIALGHPVLANGRRELLSVVREQAISRTRHRYGHLER